MPLPSRLLLLVAAIAFALQPFLPRPAASEPAPPQPDRSPVDLVLTPDEKCLITANQSAHTVSLVRVADGAVLDEQPCGQRPSAVALTPDGKTLLVSATYGGTVGFWEVADNRLRRLGQVETRFEPRGLAVSPDGRLAYVALSSAGAVAVLDVAQRRELARIPVGRWPRYLALTPDGQRLAVGVNGEGGVAIIDTVQRQRLFTEDFLGLNLGQMQTSRDGRHVYFPWMVYRHNPITSNNIRLGWVLASRIARVRFDKPARREAIALDPPGKAVSDPHGLALSSDEQWLACTASGTHELLMFRLPGLPFQDYGGPGDHIHDDLRRDSDRFFRIPLGGRPMAVRFAADRRTLFVANALENAVQVVDRIERKVVRTIALGGPKTPSLARRGEAIFYDGQRSLDQWYSCHSCHYEGHLNAVAMDTRNDGRFGNFKTVLSLRNVTKTGPWTWHGWQKDLDLAMRQSLTDSMLGPPPSADEVKAMIAFLDTLEPPPNPYRLANGQLSEAARRGQAVFQSAKAGCAKCHSGPFYTDGKIHDVGTGERGDAYRGYNPPSLIGTYDKVRYLHDGRSQSLDELLRGPHNPADLIGQGELTNTERADLIAFLQSL